MKQPFKFDIHMHTAETSKCGRIPAGELVEIYHRLGYGGIAITDHLHESYISLLYCKDDWDTCVDRFLDGYRRAKKRGDELGLSVVLGVELRFLENDNDYLIFGIDEAFLRNNPYLYRMGHEAFYKKFGGEVLIIQAHPYREKNETVYYNCVHGVELINSHSGHANYNEKTLELCKANPWLHRLCGSDVHNNGHEGKSYIMFDRPVTDSYELKAAIERGGYIIGCELEKEMAIIREAEEYFSCKQDNT